MKIIDRVAPTCVYFHQQAPHLRPPGPEMGAETQTWCKSEKLLLQCAWFREHASFMAKARALDVWPFAWTRRLGK